jgi:hypothetical protein
MVLIGEDIDNLHWRARPSRTRAATVFAVDPHGNTARIASSASLDTPWYAWNAPTRRRSALRR